MRQERSSRKGSRVHHRAQRGLRVRVHPHRLVHHGTSWLGVEGNVERPGFLHQDRCRGVSGERVCGHRSQPERAATEPDQVEPPRPERRDRRPRSSGSAGTGRGSRACWSTRSARASRGCRSSRASRARRANRSAGRYRTSRTPGSGRTGWATGTRGAAGSGWSHRPEGSGMAWGLGFTNPLCEQRRSRVPRNRLDRAIRQRRRGAFRLVEGMGTAGRQGRPRSSG
jgi:hypothetical protein